MRQDLWRKLYRRRRPSLIKHALTVSPVHWGSARPFGCHACDAGSISQPRNLTCRFIWWNGVLCPPQTVDVRMINDLSNGIRKPREITQSHWYRRGGGVKTTSAICQSMHLNQIHSQYKCDQLVPLLHPHAPVRQCAVLLFKLLPVIGVMQIDQQPGL